MQNWIIILNGQFWLKCWTKRRFISSRFRKKPRQNSSKFVIILSIKLGNILCKKIPCKWGCNQCELRQIIHFQYFEDNIARTPTWKSHPRINCTTLCSSKFSSHWKQVEKFPGLKLLSLRFEFSFAYFYPYGLFSAQMEQNGRSQRPDVCTNSANYNLKV